MHHFVTCAYLEGMLTSGESRLWVYERNSDHVFRNLLKTLRAKSPITLSVVRVELKMTSLKNARCRD